MNENERTILPSNIRQVGTLSNEKRVYVEDYAATYLQQYANADNCREKAAFLIGQEITVDGSKALFISGVIQGKYSVQKNGVVQLTEKSRQYAKKQIDIYFNGLDIVGWAYIQPGYEDSIKDGIREYHEENRDRGMDVMLLIDPQEKINSFFVYENDEFKALKGYIIYYEKNEGMHEYMLENKLKPANDEYRLISEFAAEEPMAEQAFDEERRSSAQTLREARLKRKSDKKTAGLMSTLSFVMLMVCFVMGAGLVQNDKRINELEMNVAALKTEFTAADGAQSVFAADNAIMAVTEETTETVTEPTTQETTSFDAEETTQPQLSSYRVEKGDTLSRISEKLYGTIGMMEDIMQLNGMDNADSLTEGMELVLPEE